MDPFLKKNIAVVAGILLLVIAYFSNYLPFEKSAAFIDANRQLGNVTSLQDFLKIVSTPLDASSPIGQAELVRNTGSIVSNIIRGDSGKNPAVTKALVDYMNSYYQPILAKNEGMSFCQDLYINGVIQEAAFVQTHQAEYLKAAQDIYERGIVLSPHRPQFLYGLFDVYRLKGDLPNAHRIGQEIFTLWPADTKTKALLDRVNAALASSTPSKP